MGERAHLCISVVREKSRCKTTPSWGMANSHFVERDGKGERRETSNLWGGASEREAFGFWQIDRDEQVH